jgi:hypothetical protein
MMPMMPCLPTSCCLPMAAPMMAAATPLPVACSPLIQNMYPMASMSPASLMTPSAFTSALSTGPMAFRPPASFEFPSNVGMVMPMPFGASNPLLSTPSFGGFSPQFNNGGLSCCCTFCTPPPAPPAISYYPRPVSVPQPCPVPCPVPVPMINVQQVPVPRPVTVVAPPIMSCGNEAFSVPSGAPLLPSYGAFTQGGLGQTLVMGSNKNSTRPTLFSDTTSENSKDQTSISKSLEQSRRRAKAQLLASSLSNLGLHNNLRSDITLSKAKNRTKSTGSSHNRSLITPSNSKYISESDWLSSDTLSSLLNKSKQKRSGKSNLDRHTISLSLFDHDNVVYKRNRFSKNVHSHHE